MFFIDFEIDSKKYLEKIKERWNSLQQTPTIFAYNLNVSSSKILGKCRFYLELNPERTALRRLPQQITSLTPKFDESKFNFKKVNPLERMMDIPFAHHTLVSMIINKSPLTKYHTLICPDVEMGYPQLITPQALEFCLTFLLQLEETSFRIGYNSPGALASVNHLHLHLMHINLALYIDSAELIPIKCNYVYRLSPTMPTEAVCFIISKNSSKATKSLVLNAIYSFLQWLCAEDLPHNIFMTKSREDERTESSVKIFIFVREKHCVIKDVTAFNIGFCELSGYIPVGSKELYENLTEEMIISKISTETGNIYKNIYKYFHDKNSTN